VKSLHVRHDSLLFGKDRGGEELVEKLHELLVLHGCFALFFAQLDLGKKNRRQERGKERVVRETRRKVRNERQLLQQQLLTDAPNFNEVYLGQKSWRENCASYPEGMRKS